MSINPDYYLYVQLSVKQQTWPLAGSGNYRWV